MLLLGRALSGAEAAEWGLVHRAVPAAELDAAVDEIVDRLATGPTVALGLTKWLLTRARAPTLDAQLANEAFALELSSRSEDFREGLAAFREKRAAALRREMNGSGARHAGRRCRRRGARCAWVDERPGGVAARPARGGAAAVREVRAACRVRGVVSGVRGVGSGGAHLAGRVRRPRRRRRRPPG